MAHHDLPEEEEQFRENDVPEEKKSQRMLLLLLLLLIILFAYLYFFTSLIRPRPQAAPAAKPSAEAPVVKKPMPARVAQTEGGAAAPETAAAGKQAPAQPGAQPGQKPAKAQPAEKAGAAPEAKGAKPAGTEAKGAKPAGTAKPAAPAKTPAPPAAAAKGGKPAGEAKAAKPAAAEPHPGKAVGAKPGAGAEAKGGKPAGAAAAKGTAASEKGKGPAAATVAKKGAKPTQAKGAEGTAAEEAAAAKGKTAAAGKGKAALPGASKAAAGGAYALDITGDIAEGEVGPVVTKLKKAGITRFVKTRSKKNEEMHRLFLADFANRAEAQEELERLKQAAPEAFMLPENGRYAVYAGSYLRETKAAATQDRLYDKGVKLLMRKKTVSVPMVKLRAGSFRDKGTAARAAETLKKEGVSAAVVKAGK